MISNSIGNPSDTMNFLNEVTESKIFTEKSLIAYKALDRYEQFPAERPTDVNVFEKKVAYMKEGAVYSAEDLGIK